jgi:hypothetical protein
MRLWLGGVYEVGELHRVLDKEDWDVVANEIPVAFVRVELHGEATDIPRGVRRATFAEDRREAHEDRCLFADLTQE